MQIDSIRLYAHEKIWSSAWNALFFFLATHASSIRNIVAKSTHNTMK